MRIFWNGLAFDSIGETVCAQALEKFVHGWRCIEGETFQVPIGHRKFCDFKVENTLIEYHPIALAFEMSKHNYRALQYAIKNLPRAKRREIRDVLKAEFLEQYYKKRRWTLDLHERAELANVNLIVVDSPDVLYNKIIRRQQANCQMSRKAFCIWFDQVSRQLLKNKTARIS